MRKRLKDLMRYAARLGYDAEPTRNGHIRFRHPNRRVGLVIGSSTPSDVRSVLNTKAQLKRNLRAAGL